MIHSQSPWSMDIIQNWPVSLEAQLLGSTSKVLQTTGNICTPGTNITYQGMFTEEHCISSSSGNYYGEDWVTIDIIVNDSNSIYHVINGDTILAYTQPKIGGGLLPENYPVKKGTMLSDGYIALQAEGQPIEFRKILLKKMNAPDIVETPVINLLPQKNPVEVMIDGFDDYENNDHVSKTWHHSESFKSTLEPVIKGDGRYSLKCDYFIKKNETHHDSRLFRVDKWDLDKCNGLIFWLKPDGSGRELTITFTTADANSKWEYKYKTEIGDTSARFVTFPFSSLSKISPDIDSPNSRNFNPKSVIEISLSIGRNGNNPGKGTFISTK
ncbi:MAG: DUF1080 domain-containing protein [Bacteroidales bacterium]|nr:DUF1080 domain-containing protein [Bacteroidales bacterium]